MAISKTQPMRPAEIDLIDAYNEIIQDIPTLETTIETLVTEVGDENSGLVKDVNDLDTAVNGLSSAIGDENSGLVKDVDVLQSDVSSLQDTVGDENSGVVKDIDDLEDAVFGLQTVVGDENSGLVKDITDMQTKIESYAKSGDLSSATGSNVHKFQYTGKIGVIFLGRNQTNNPTRCILMCDHHSPYTPFFIGDHSTITAIGNSDKEITITILENSGAVAYMTTPNTFYVSE